jgi:hypothetical protein
MLAGCLQLYISPIVSLLNIAPVNYSNYIKSLYPESLTPGLLASKLYFRKDK